MEALVDSPKRRVFAGFSLLSLFDHQAYSIPAPLITWAEESLSFLSPRELDFRVGVNMGSGVAAAAATAARGVPCTRHAAIVSRSCSP